MSEVEAKLAASEADKADAASKAKDLQAGHDTTSAQVSFFPQTCTGTISTERLSSTKLGTANDKLEGLEAENGLLAERLKEVEAEAAAALQKVCYHNRTSPPIEPADIFLYDMADRQRITKIRSGAWIATRPS